MKQIWKFVLDSTGLEVKLPKNAVILLVHEQQNNICIWAEVQTNVEYEVRFFEVFGTGHNIPSGNRKYLGTVFILNGLVFHVYERL